MIKVENISKYYGSHKAVDGVSFEMSRGEVVGFLGPNGAGKTTTMRILTGFLPSSDGTCLVAGLDVQTHGVEARKKIGYLPETTPLYGDMEVTEYLRYVGCLRGLQKQALQDGLGEVVKTCGLKQVLGKKINTLSKGYRQRVGLAQALIHRPEILILDEPTLGLDPNQIVEIRQLIKNIGKERTVLLSTHILSEVEQTCERVIIISNGKIVGQGTPKELMAKTHGAPVYYVGIRGTRKSIEESVCHLFGFQNLDFVSSEGELHSLRLSLNDHDDHSEEIFKLAVEKQWSIFELRREFVGLEDVFKVLTK